jgi:uncharacterized protein (TIGR02421 family)
MEWTTEHQRIDEELLKYRIGIEPWLEAKNLPEQKKLFLENKIKEPILNSFVLGNNEEENKKIREIENILIPKDDGFGKVLQSIKENLLNQYEIIKNRGNKEKTIDLSIKINSRPDEKLVEKAKKILSEPLCKVENKEEIETKIVKESLEQAFKNYNLQDWKVECVEKEITQTDAPNKRILIAKNRRYFKGDEKRLVVHEIGVHVLRSVNGLNQPFKNLAYGLPGYIQTEEGLAAYMEEINNLLDEKLMRNYAGRVLAVNSIIDGFSFKQTFEMLKTYNFDENISWTLTVRAHRGGGYIKDHVYLDGYSKIKEYISEGGDVKILFLGKFALNQLEIIKALLEKGFLNPPKILPKF